ncbi:MAG: preprotein translocase subunit SecG [Buchnera aphidicola (Meitanaphis microgallis)]
MYNFFLGVFIFVSVLLIFLIMIQNGKDNDTSSNFNLGKSKREIMIHYHDNILTKIIGIFAFLFFLVSLIICNISYNNIF